MKTIIACALALAIGAPAAATAAEAFDVTTSIRVSHSDLDLNQTRDAATMIRRLDRAALQACGASTFSLREYKAAVRASSCYRDGMNQSVASLGAPAVTDLYRQRAPMMVAAK